LKISHDKCREFAEAIKELDIPYDDFASPKYYPPKGEPEEKVARYFLFMTAIDHRTSRPNNPYQITVGGEKLKGASLLYFLGARKYEEDPDFFSPYRMARITLEDFSEWLNVKDASIPDPGLRVFLLRDAARKLLLLYRGQAMELIKSAYGRLYAPQGEPWREGIIEKLKVFRAYEDPVEKKPFLLCKFLERRGILKIADKENARVPVDNHLTRIAVRLELVDFPEYFKPLFKWERKASKEEDVIIRLYIREAYSYVCRLSSMDPFVLDDFLWNHGRTVCLPENPACEKCPLRKLCKGLISDEVRSLKEHYYSTWYY